MIATINDTAIAGLHSMTELKSNVGCIHLKTTHKIAYPKLQVMSSEATKL